MHASVTVDDGKRNASTYQCHTCQPYRIFRYTTPSVLLAYRNFLRIYRISGENNNAFFIGLEGLDMHVYTYTTVARSVIMLVLSTTHALLHMFLCLCRMIYTLFCIQFGNIIVIQPQAACLLCSRPFI